MTDHPEVTVSTTVPAAVPEAAAAPRIRFAALRGLGPLPWGAVAGMAVLLAFVDGFVVVALQGAVGAIERAQSPFTTWLRYSAVLVPVFGIAVMWALARAHRKHDLASTAMRTARRTLTTGLLVAAAATAVAVVAYDYHLQSQLLATTQTLHSHAVGPGGSTDPAYADGAWTPQQRDTMLVDVKAVGYGAVLLAGVNVVLVAWCTALRGGRLGVVRGRTRPAG